MSAGAPVVLLSGPGSRRLEALALEAAAEIVCGPGFDPESSAARRVFRREHPDLMVAAPERRRRVNPPPFDETDGKETTLPTALVRAVAADATRERIVGGRRRGRVAVRTKRVFVGGSSRIFRSALKAAASVRSTSRKRIARRAAS